MSYGDAHDDDAAVAAADADADDHDDDDDGVLDSDSKEEDCDMILLSNAEGRWFRCETSVGGVYILSRHHGLCECPPLCQLLGVCPRPSPYRYPSQQRAAARGQDWSLILRKTKPVNARFHSSLCSPKRQLSGLPR